MPLFDEYEEAGLEEELQDETVDETADEEVPSGPLDSLASIAELRNQLSSASSEAEKNRKVLEQIQAARLKLLEAPSRKEALMGLAQKLAAPRTQDDPRFYERRNLYTFLRDVGEYGQEQKQAEKERLAKIAALEEMGAKYGLTEAQKTQESAMRGLTSLTQRQMMIEAQKGRVVGTSEFERLIANLPPKEQERMRRQRAQVMASRAPRAEKEKTGPGGEAEQILWATETMASDTATAAQKDAARRILEKKEPRDIRADRIKKEKYADSYLGRIKDQNEFTIPDIQSAIDQIDEGGIFVAGNIARIIRGVPIIGQAATDLEKTMESIQAKVGFDKMLQLKETSPTGSTGLGAVSNAEQRLLQSVKGSLDKDQRPENLRRNLVRLKDFYEKDAFEILNRETGIQGLSGIDETLSSLSQGREESAAPAAPMIDPEALRKERQRRKELKKAGGG
jgi:hypothetical protein